MNDQPRYSGLASRKKLDYLGQVDHKYIQIKHVDGQKVLLVLVYFKRKISDEKILRYFARQALLPAKSSHLMAFDVDCFEGVEPFDFVALGESSFDDYAEYFSFRQAKKGNKKSEICAHIGDEDPVWEIGWYFLAYQPIN